MGSALIYFALVAPVLILSILMIFQTTGYCFQRSF
ncbi:MAG: pilus assembly protein [Bacteroidales bacterium]|nr:pilus assembly protein [Bacteroidales bacterium]